MYTDDFVARLRTLPIAEAADQANRQHYELPVAFFTRMLGPRMKYSSCYYRDEQEALDEAEEHMLRLTCARANLKEGMDILELGCGWGSLTLWIAEQYPTAHITAVTNSALQAGYVRARAQAAGVQERVLVTLADIDGFDTKKSYDRVVSVEMFEHVRNYGSLFGRIRTWLRPNGKLFVHVFSHRLLPYLFETEGGDDWMGRYFFTGGTMPSHDLLPRFAGDFRVEKSWRVNGKHYARTLEDWLKRLDHGRRPALNCLEDFYGAREARLWFSRWRIFLMACSELFAFQNGESTLR